MTPHRASLAFVALAAALGLAAPAHADWSFTRWGMSPEEVITAAGGKAKPIDGGVLQRVMNMDYRAYGGPFTYRKRVYTATFYFDLKGGRGLRVVRLALVDQSQCDALGAELEKRYGASSNEYYGAWVDKATGDTVSFSNSFKGSAPIPCYLLHSRV